MLPATGPSGSAVPGSSIALPQPVDTAPIIASVQSLADTRDRIIVAIAGAPGAGKSTLAGQLQTAFRQTRNEDIALLPMDGYHFDNTLLAERGQLQTKGAPYTFDVAKYLDTLTRVRANRGEVLAPEFDRMQDCTRPDAIRIGTEHRVVVTEGNYLLFDEAPWRDARDLFDLTIFLDVDIRELERRLQTRWRNLGLPPSEIERKVHGNDLANARAVIARSVAADLTVRC